MNDLYVLIIDKWFISMFWGVSNYSFRPMEKTYFRILLILVFITSLCNSQDYTYDENYDYYNENNEYYTDDYSQELNDYYGQQNLIAPGPSPIPPPFIPPPPTPPPPPPQPGNYIIVC